jgi:catechol 2,3-dioxygenase-like lactoylglutathione lyase family enzyme
LIVGLGYVCLEVSDLERSLAFYLDGLRFECDRRDDDPRPRVVLRAGDLRLVLDQAAVRRNGRRPGIRLSMEVSGLDVYHDALVARGVSVTFPADEDGRRAFTVRDPDGYLWTFHQSPT